MMALRALLIFKNNNDTHQPLPAKPEQNNAPVFLFPVAFVDNCACFRKRYFSEAAARHTMGVQYSEKGNTYVLVIGWLFFQNVIDC
jgi:hypothetical protein